MVPSAQGKRAVNCLSNWQPLTEACQSSFVANVLFGKILRLTSSKVIYIFNRVWTPHNLEKRAMDNNDQIHFKSNCQEKRIAPAFPSTLH